MDTKKILELKSLIQSANQEDTSGYVVRFITKNAELSDSDFEEKFLKDQEDRAEADRVEQHRKEKVLEQVSEFDDTTKQALIQQLLGGVSSQSETTSTNQTINVKGE